MESLLNDRTPGVVYPTLGIFKKDWSKYLEEITWWFPLDNHEVCQGESSAENAGAGAAGTLLNDKTPGVNQATPGTYITGLL